MRDIALHRAVISKILVDLYKNNFITNKLGFKGGTACYFFYDLPRFSIDLDFNLINREVLDKSNLNLFVEKIENILNKYGKVEQFFHKQKTLFWLLNYRKGQWNIKVEISIRDFGDEFQLKDFLGIQLPVMKKEFVFAHKLVALTDRRNPVARDVFDINFFIKQDWEIVGRIIEERTKMSASDYLKSLPRFVERNFPKSKILDGVGELLDKPLRDHYKAKLYDEVVTNLRLLAENCEAYLC